MQTQLELAEMRAQEAERLYMETVQRFQTMQADIEHMKAILVLVCDIAGVLRDSLPLGTLWEEAANIHDDVWDRVRTWDKREE